MAKLPASGFGGEHKGGDGSRNGYIRGVSEGRIIDEEVNAMKTIVALVDFSELTTKVVRMAHRLSSALGSRLVLLHVVPPEPVVGTLGVEAPMIPEPPTQEQVEAEKKKLQGLLDSLNQTGAGVTALQFEGPVAGTALEETRKLHPDMVVMGAHHHNALYNLLVGSMSADMLKGASCPVLMVPADEPEKSPVARSAEELQEQAMAKPMLSV